MGRASSLDPLDHADELGLLVALRLAKRTNFWALAITAIGCWHLSTFHHPEGAPEVSGSAVVAA